MLLSWSTFLCGAQSWVRHCFQHLAWSPFCILQDPPFLPCFEVSCVQSSPLHFISGCISTHCIWFERITPHIPCAVHSLWGSAVTLLQLSCPSLILRQLFSAGQSLRPSFCFCSLCIFILADFLIQHLLHLLPFKSSPISLPYFSISAKTMRMRMTLWQMAIVWLHSRETCRSSNIASGDNFNVHFGRLEGTAVMWWWWWTTSSALHEFTFTTLLLLLSEVILDMFKKGSTIHKYKPLFLPSHS